MDFGINQYCKLTFQQKPYKKLQVACRVEEQIQYEQCKKQNNAPCYVIDEYSFLTWTRQPHYLNIQVHTTVVNKRLSEPYYRKLVQAIYMLIAQLVMEDDLLTEISIPFFEMTIDREANIQQMLKHHLVYAASFAKYLNKKVTIYYATEQDALWHSLRAVLQSQNVSTMHIQQRLVKAELEKLQVKEKKWMEKQGLDQKQALYNDLAAKNTMKLIAYQQKQMLTDLYKKHQIEPRNPYPSNYPKKELKDLNLYPAWYLSYFSFSYDLTKKAETFNRLSKEEQLLYIWMNHRLMDMKVDLYEHHQEVK